MTALELLDAALADLEAERVLPATAQRAAQGRTDARLAELRAAVVRLERAADHARDIARVLAEEVGDG